MTNIERKIEFRVWLKTQKTMRYNVSIHARQIFTGYCWIPFDNNIKLMQSTGLKDKNGIEIFEGDIVKTYKLNANKHFEDITREHDEFIGVITWDENCLKYCIQKNNTEYEDMLKPFERYYEVIGNIYENGDLLICKN